MKTLSERPAVCVDAFVGLFYRGKILITHLVHVPIFGRSVFFVGGCPAEDAEEAIYRLRKKRTQVSLTHTADGCVRDSGGDVFVWVKDLKRASVVAHELAHAACTIMEVCGIPQCRETEEIMCYLIGWLKINVQDKIYTKLENSKQKENHNESDASKNES